MHIMLKNTSVAIAVATTMLLATPAVAADQTARAPAIEMASAVSTTFDLGFAEQSIGFDDERRWRRDRRDRRYNRDRRDRGYDERVGRDTRVWRGRDGAYYCRKEDGTTGLLIGAVVGGLAGRELARDRTLGAIIGAAAGGLAGREIDRSDSRCR